MNAIFGDQFYRRYINKISESELFMNKQNRFVCLYMQLQKVEFTSVQINMKQVSFLTMYTVIMNEEKHCLVNSKMHGFKSCLYHLFASLTGLYSFHRGEQGVSDQMTSIDVKDEYQCALLCTMNPDCQQFNLNDLGTKKVCELLLSAVGTTNYPPTVTHYSLQ